MDQPSVTPELSEIPSYTPRRFWPVATFVLVALNVVIFLFMELAGGSKNTDVLMEFGAAYGPYFRHGEYWRLVMPMFLHIGWIHLLLNMYALYVLGPILERVYGYGRYTFLYVATGMGSSYLTMEISEVLRNPPSVAAGASGAIMGIAGVMLVTGYLHRELVPPRWGRAFGRGILPVILLTLGFGFFVSHIVDNWGHVGGLVTGMVLAALIPPPARHEALASRDEGEPSQALIVVPLLLVAFSMAATIGHYRKARGLTDLLVEAERFRAQHQTDKALERFWDAARLAPEDERPHEELGSIYLEQKRPREAMQEYQEALRLNPGSSRAQLGLALAFEQQGQHAQAQKLLEAVLGKNPGTAEGHQLLGDLYLEQKLYAEAIRHYQEALRLRPDMAVAHNNLAWLLATSEDERLRDPSQALEHARRAVELSNWKEATYIDTLAEALYASRSFGEAVKVQTRALQLDPNNREYQDHMARYRKAGGL